jgi:hypothetical protein
MAYKYGQNKNHNKNSIQLGPYSTKVHINNRKIAINEQSAYNNLTDE